MARLSQRLAFAVWDQGEFERAQRLLAEGKGLFEPWLAFFAGDGDFL